LLFPRPGADYVAPGKKGKKSEFFLGMICKIATLNRVGEEGEEGEEEERDL
jgi:hypothetical protein